MKRHLLLAGACALASLSTLTSPAQAPDPAVRAVVSTPDAQDAAGKIAYLGLAGVPVSADLARHLGLSASLYLSIVAVQPGSPADQAGLRDGDILTHLDDQILVNQPQLQQLVRMHKKGDAVTLRYLRAGKEQTAKATLAERDAPRETAADGFDAPFQGLPRGADPFWGGSPDDAQDHMRRLREQMFRNMPRHPMRGLPEPDEDDASASSTQVQSSASRSVTMNNEKGRFTFAEKDGAKTFKAEDKDGKVLFDGPVNTEDERKKVPAELEDTLRQMESGDMGGVHLHFGPGKKNRPGQKGQAI